MEPTAVSAAYRAAREGLAHRVRNSAVLDIEGFDRESFLQGQLTQDLRGLASGESRPAAALTSKGKLLFVARLVGMPDRVRLLLPATSRLAALGHLRKFAAFQKVTISDRSDELIRIGLYGPEAARFTDLASEGLPLPASDEFAMEWLVLAGRWDAIEILLERKASVQIDPVTAEVLRVEAGRARFGQDIDESNLPDEAGLEAAISTVKGCYVGQEIVARRRTYGRLNRRLVGYRFADGPLPPGAVLRRGEAPEASNRTEAGRVTSSVVSPRFGPIGLGFAFHDVPLGTRLLWQTDSNRAAIVSALPFA